MYISRKICHNSPPVIFQPLENTECIVFDICPSSRLKTIQKNTPKKIWLNFLKRNYLHKKSFYLLLSILNRVTLKGKTDCFQDGANSFLYKLAPLIWEENICLTEWVFPQTFPLFSCTVGMHVFWANPKTACKIMLIGTITWWKGTIPLSLYNTIARSLGLKAVSLLGKQLSHLSQNIYII